jgi:transposase
VELRREKHLMRTVIANHHLTPRGLQLEALNIEAGKVTIFANSRESRARCPVCASGSSRVHSRYLRTVSDLPWHGISIELEVRARRFFCDESSCERKIFCERLPEVAARARKTSRLEEALLAIALELGGRAGVRLALELGILAARDALLRRIKAAPLPEVGKVRVLGVDDFAFKKGSTYGTILVNLEDHKVVDLLAERSQESLVAWFRSHLRRGGGGGGHPRPFEHLPGRIGQRRSPGDTRGRPLAPAPQPHAHIGRIPAPEAARTPKSGSIGG